MSDLLHLLLVSNNDLRTTLVLAEEHLSKRKYDAKASQIAKALRESLRTARRVAQLAEAERLKATKKGNISRASVPGREHVVSQQGADSRGH